MVEDPDQAAVGLINFWAESASRERAGERLD
jgi:hypothetical protein